MKVRILIPAFLSLAGLTAVFLLMSSPVGQTYDYEDWPETSRAVIDLLKKKYGEPAEKTSDMFVWTSCHPWKRIAVHRNDVKHNFPSPHTDMLEQVIDYRVPADKSSELAKFNGSLVVNRTAGELAVYCGQEEWNYLIINLANDIVSGTKDAISARAYELDAVRSIRSGDTLQYCRGFNFNVPRGKSADPDSSPENSSMDLPGIR